MTTVSRTLVRGTRDALGRQRAQLRDETSADTHLKRESVRLDAQSALLGEQVWPREARAQIAN